MIKISVIIPVFNLEDYIVQCLDCIINQTLKDIEIICVNDGSSDNSGGILRKYAKNDYRIKVIEHEHNKGLSAARNTGINNALGEYIYFMDGDDLLELNALESCYIECEKNNLDVLTFDADVFFDEDTIDIRSKYGKKQELNYNRRKLLNEDTIFPGKQFFYHAFIQNAYKPSACLSFIKLDLLKENKLAFYPGILHEDELFTIQLYFASSRIKYCPRQFFKRRIRLNSITSDKTSSRNIQDILFISAELYKICLREKDVKVKKILLKYIFLLLGWMERIMIEITDNVELAKCKILLKKSSIWRRYKSNKRLKDMKRNIKNLILGRRF